MSEDMRQDPASVLDERALVAAMLRQEAALAHAQAALGWLSSDKAQSIVNTCKVDLFDVPHILRQSASSPSGAEPPLIKSLRETVRLFNPAAAEAVYPLGQPADLLCNALALVTRDALNLLSHEVDALAQQPATSDVRRAWAQVQHTADAALRLRLSTERAFNQGTLAQLQPPVSLALGLGLAHSEGSEDWMALGCALGVFILCAQRAAGLDQALHAPLWVAQWLTELAKHTIRPTDARDFWRDQWPLWSTLVLAAVRSVDVLKRGPAA